MLILGLFFVKKTKKTLQFCLKWGVSKASTTYGSRDMVFSLICISSSPRYAILYYIDPGSVDSGNDKKNMRTDFSKLGS